MLPWQCPIGHFLSLLASSQAMRNEKLHSCAGMQAMAGHPGTPPPPAHVTLKARQRDSENNPKGASRQVTLREDLRPIRHLLSSGSPSTPEMLLWLPCSLTPVTACALASLTFTDFTPILQLDSNRFPLLRCSPRHTHSNMSFPSPAADPV